MGESSLLRILDEYKSKEVSMLMRHGPRHRIPRGVTEHQNVPLTSRGRVMAFEFGKDLPNDTLVRLFYSPIPRCRETAECINKGVIRNKGSAVLMGDREYLGTHCVIDLKTMVRMMEKIGGWRFVRRWLDGKIERAIMNNPHQVVSRIMNGLIAAKREKKGNEQTIDIHVTHDLNIIALKEILLDARLEKTGWTDYLDGVTLVHDTDQITLRWREITRTLDYGTLTQLSPPETTTKA